MSYSPQKSHFLTNTNMKVRMEWYQSSGQSIRNIFLMLYISIWLKILFSDFKYWIRNNLDGKQPRCSWYFFLAFCLILTYFRHVRILVYVITVDFEVYNFLECNSKQQNYFEKFKNRETPYNWNLKRHLLMVFIVHTLKEMFNHSLEMF